MELSPNTKTPDKIAVNLLAGAGSARLGSYSDPQAWQEVAGAFSWLACTTAVNEEYRIVMRAAIIIAETYAEHLQSQQAG